MKVSKKLILSLIIGSMIGASPLMHTGLRAMEANEEENFFEVDSNSVSVTEPKDARKRSASPCDSEESQNPKRQRTDTLAAASSLGDMVEDDDLIPVEDGQEKDGESLIVTRSENKVFFPTDVLREIFKYLNLSNLTKMQRVCRQWEDLSSNQNLQVATSWNILRGGSLHEDVVNNLDKTLFDASEVGDSERALAALIVGANVNHANNYGQTALIWAAAKGHTEVVRILLQVPGIDVNYANNNGSTALIWAAYCGHTEVVRILLETPGINVNHAEKSGETALIWAASYGYTEIVRMLKKKISFWHKFPCIIQ